MSTTANTSPATRNAAIGAVAGMIGATMMAMYAMVASITYHHVGIFTPLYHIATTFLAPTALQTSMQQAMAGHSFYFTLGPALVGMLVHFATGAMAGALFGVLVGRYRPGRAVTVAAGAGYGLLVMVVNAFVGLPVAAHMFGGGSTLSKMPTMVGWGTFTIEHLIFGMVLGVVVAAWASPQRHDTSSSATRLTARSA